MREIVLKCALKASWTDTPVTADAFAHHRANPALRKVIQGRSAWRNGDCLDATGGQGVPPSCTELSVPVVNQVAGADLVKPVAIFGYRFLVDEPTLSVGQPEAVYLDSGLKTGSCSLGVSKNRQACRWRQALVLEFPTHSRPITRPI